MALRLENLETPGLGGVSQSSWASGARGSQSSRKDFISTRNNARALTD